MILFCFHFLGTEGDDSQTGIYTSGIDRIWKTNNSRGITRMLIFDPILTLTKYKRVYFAAYEQADK